MITAYLLIITRSGQEKKVIAKLEALKQVKEAAIVYGEYDLVAKIELEDVSQLNDFLLEKIRPINGVDRTSTLIVAA